ncbi:hypothetical protein VTN96DRAFT_9766 [Rasamsonia emersonii]
MECVFLPVTAEGRIELCHSHWRPPGDRSQQGSTDTRRSGSLEFGSRPYLLARLRWLTVAGGTQRLIILGSMVRTVHQPVSGSHEAAILRIVKKARGCGTLSAQSPAWQPSSSSPANSTAACLRASTSPGTPSADTADFSISRFRPSHNATADHCWARPMTSLVSTGCSMLVEPSQPQFGPSRGRSLADPVRNPGPAIIAHKWPRREPMRLGFQPARVAMLRGPVVQHGNRCVFSHSRPLRAAAHGELQAGLGARHRAKIGLCAPATQPTLAASLSRIGPLSGTLTTALFVVLVTGRFYIWVGGRSLRALLRNCTFCSRLTYARLTKPSSPPYLTVTAIGCDAAVASRADIPTNTRPATSFPAPYAPLQANLGPPEPTIILTAFFHSLMPA